MVQMTCVCPEALFLPLFTVTPKTPSLSVNPSNATTESGTFVVITCATNSIGTTTYIFYNGSSSVQSGPESTYNLTSATTTDSGLYTCVAVINGVSSMASNSHILTIVGKCNLHFVHNVYFILEMLCRQRCCLLVPSFVMLTFVMSFVHPSGFWPPSISFA